MSWPSLTEQIVETLFANAFYSAILFAILMPVVWLLRRRSPQLRHALWTIVMLRLALPPSFRLPFSAGNLFGGIDNVATAALATTLTFGSEVPATATQTASGLVLFSLWLCGATATATVMIRSRLKLRNLVRQAARVETPVVLETLEHHKNHLGIKRRVEIVAGPGEYGAFTIGTLNPVIFMPDRLLSQLSPAAVGCVIAHELSHVKRLDDLDRQIQAFLQSIYCFNPVAWIAGALRSQENELVCDGLAIRRGELIASDYGRSILEVFRLGANPMPHTPMFLGRTRTMRQRIESALHARPTSRVLTIVAIALAVFLLPMAGNSLQATFDKPASLAADDPIRVEGDVVAPKAVQKVSPVYPSEARKEGLEGVVVVLATINTKGKVTDTEAIESTRDDFAAAALDAVRQWKFEPATLEEKPVAVEFRLTVRFRLK